MAINLPLSRNEHNIVQPRDRDMLIFDQEELLGKTETVSSYGLAYLAVESRRRFSCLIALSPL